MRDGFLTIPSYLKRLSRIKNFLYIYFLYSFSSCVLKSFGVFGDYFSNFTKKNTCELFVYSIFGKILLAYSPTIIKHCWRMVSSSITHIWRESDSRFFTSGFIHESVFPGPWVSQWGHFKDKLSSVSLFPAIICCRFRWHRWLSRVPGFFYQFRWQRRW